MVRVTAAIPLLLAGCVSGVAIDEGAPCPCADGYECCPETNTCQLNCPVRDAGFRDGGVRDTGFRDAGPPPVDAGFYDGGAPVDAGIPAASIGPWTWSNIDGTTNRTRDFTVTWTGEELLMVGGDVGGCAVYHDRYNPRTDQWRRFQLDLVSRGGHSAVWTGEALLVWGGNVCGLDDDTFSDGAFYHPFFHTTSPIEPAPGGAAFHVSAWLGDRLFVYGGECHATSCLDRGAIYDMTTNQWTNVSTEDAPMPFGGARTGQWNGSQVLVWGGADSSGRYFPHVDAWQTFPAPMFELGVGPSVWTGSELIVWDGTTGGRFDPLTSTWTRTSTAGAPVGVERPRAVWTGAEMIVIGLDGGAHYDPTADRWRPVTPNNAYWAPENSRVVWTGAELFVVGSNLAGGTHGARYGPRLAGDPACNGGEPPLHVEIDLPTARTILPEISPLESIITTEFSLQRVTWTFDGEPIADRGDATFDTTDRTPGMHVLRLEAEDGQGNVSCDSRAVFIDPRPTIDVALPLDRSVARPTIEIVATCTDDHEDGCTIRALVEDEVVATSTKGAGRLSATADLSSYEGAVIDLSLEATDRFGQVVRETRRIYVESSPLLSRHAVADDPICDVTPTRLLLGGSQFGILDVATSSVVRVPTAGAPVCGDSRLVEPDAALLRAGTQGLDVVGSVVRSTFSSGSFRVGGDWVLGVNGTSLERRQPSSAFFENLGTRPYPGEGFDIAETGDAIWQDRDNGTITFEPFGGVASVVGTQPATTISSPAVGTTASLFRRREGASQWTLVAVEHTTGATIAVAGPFDSTPQGPRRDVNYFANGGWLAYEAPDIMGVSQVWRRAPGGTPELVTGFGDPTQLAGLGSDGELIYRRAGRLVLLDVSTGDRIDLGGEAGVVRHRNGTWFVQYGREVFAVSR